MISILRFKFTHKDSHSKYQIKNIMNPETKQNKNIMNKITHSKLKEIIYLVICILRIHTANTKFSTHYEF